MTTRRKQIAGIACLVFVLAIAWWTWQSFGPPPKIVVSRQTTYLTEPLAEDGLPHFGQALRDSQREGVTPENNGAVPFWQAMWPGVDNSTVSDQVRHAFAQELGIEPELLDPRQRLNDSWSDMVAELVEWQQSEMKHADLPKDSEGDIIREEQSAEQGAFGFEQSYRERDPWKDWADSLIDYSRDTPWKTHQIPPLADRMEKNRRQLDLLVEAAERPRWYSPSSTLLSGERWAVLNSFGFDMPQIQACREVSRALSQRAMAHLGNGDLDAAWRDLRATHLFAQHLVQGESIVTQLVATAISGIASDKTHQLLSHPDLSPELARQVLADLMAFERIPQLGSALNHGERFFSLEGLLQIETDPAGAVAVIQSWGKQGASFELLPYLSVDLNVVLPLVNEVIDLMVAAAEKPSAIQRQQAMREFQHRLNELTEFQGIVAFLSSTVNRTARAHLLAAEWIELATPALNSALAAQDRSYTQLALMRLAAALAVYRTENGEYPETLEALVPDILDKLPMDSYQELPFAYQRTDNGFLLYSLGANGRDDGGSHAQRGKYRGYPIHEDTANSVKNLLGNQDLDFSDEHLIPPEADDISIRYPLPVADFPEPPQTVPAE